MTSAQALPGAISKVFYVSLITSVFVFISMLLFTGLHPERLVSKALNALDNGQQCAGPLPTED